VRFFPRGVFEFVAFLPQLDDQMRRSAAPSYRAAKRGRFIPPILAGRKSEDIQNQVCIRHNKFGKEVV